MRTRLYGCCRMKFAPSMLSSCQAGPKSAKSRPGAKGASRGIGSRVENRDRCSPSAGKTAVRNQLQLWAELLFRLLRRRASSGKTRASQGSPCSAAGRASHNAILWRSFSSYVVILNRRQPVKDLACSANDWRAREVPPAAASRLSRRMTTGPTYVMPYALLDCRSPFGSSLSRPTSIPGKRQGFLRRTESRRRRGFGESKDLGRPVSPPNPAQVWRPLLEPQHSEHDLRPETNRTIQPGETGRET